MSEQTQNYGLVKPAANEYYDILLQNNNMDIIDAEIKKANDKTDKKVEIGNDYRPNILINGNFKVNQRGQSSYPVANAYSVDRWINYGANTTVTPNADGINISCTYTNDSNLLRQIIEMVKDYKGQQFTISMKYKNLSLGSNSLLRLVLHSDVAGSSIGVDTAQSSGIVTATGTIPENSTSMFVRLSKIGTGSAFSVDIEWIKLEMNNHASPFIPRIYGEELALCQRYYEKSDGFESNICHGNNQILGFPFKVCKRVVPVIKISTQDGVANKVNQWGNLSIQLEVASATAYLDKVTLLTVPNSATGNRYVYNWTADAEL